MPEQQNEAAEPAAEELPRLDAAEMKQGADQAAQKTIKVSVNDVVEAQVAQIVSVMVRGITVSSPGVAPSVYLPAIARATGKILAILTTGGANNLQASSNARIDFKRAFEAGLAQVPLLASPGSAQKN